MSTKAWRAAMGMMLLVALAWCADAAWAQPPTPATDATLYQGIDLVVLIDQSGSMWGHPEYHPEANDLRGHRIGETQSLIQQLAAHARMTGAVHRAAVVDFGDDAAVALSNHVMRFDRDNPVDVESATASVVERTVTAKDWINTNTPEAMRVGLEEFRKMDAAEALTERLKVMLIITDGRANLPEFKDQMPGRVRTQAAETKAAGVELYVVGLNDADNYWLDGDGEFWQELTGPGRAILAETASTRIAQIFREVLADWLGRLATPGGGGPAAAPVGPTSCITETLYAAPPYLTQLTFAVSYGVPRSSLTITAPDGLPVPLTSGSPTSTSARFERRDPPPGNYAIVKDPSKYYCIVPEVIGPRVDRVSPGPAVDPGREQSIVFQALRDDGTPLVLLLEWPVNVAVEVKEPDGTIQSLPASLDGQGRASASWTPGQPGVHELRLIGNVDLPGGVEYDIFGQSSAYERAVEVSDRRPVWLDVVAPEPATRSATVLPWSPQLLTEVRLTDDKGNPIDAVAEALADPGSWLTAQRVDADGLPIGDPVAFTPLGSEALQAAISVPFGWDMLIGRAEERIRITSDPGQLSVAFAYGGLRGDADAAGFISNDGAQATIGPIALTTPTWVRAALWLLPVLLLLAVLGVAGYVVGPGILVWREDRSQAQDVALWIFDGLNDPNGYTARKFPVTGWHRFKFDKGLTLRFGDKEFIAERLRVMREPSAGAAMAQVEYRWPDDKKVHRTLVKAGSPPKPLQGIEADNNWVIALKQFK